MRRVPQRLSQHGVALVPPARVDLFTIRHGWFAVGDGLDGVLLTGDRRIVTGPAMFSTPGRVSTGIVDLDLPASSLRFDRVFIGFDAAWTNWFHWLCFAIPRSAFAADLLPPDCPIIMPDYTARTGIRYTETTWRQSLAAFGLAERVTLLPPGLYAADAIHFFWTQPTEPTDITYLSAFHALFARVRRGLHRRPELPCRILLLRERDPRLTPGQAALVQRLAAEHDFHPVGLEHFDFTAQAEMIFNADAVIGAHGAGLANILFGRIDLNVLELNLPLDGPYLLRPWFYLLAHTRRQSYRFLNTAAGDLVEHRLAPAIEAIT